MNPELLLIEHEVHRQHQTDESREVIPVQRFALEKHGGEYGEDYQRYYFLDDLQLHQRKRAAVADEADAIGWNLKRILGKSYHPREKDDGVERPVGNNLQFLKFQVTIPRKGHEDIGNNQE